MKKESVKKTQKNKNKTDQNKNKETKKTWNNKNNKKQRKNDWEGKNLTFMKVFLLFDMHLQEACVHRFCI